MLFTLRPKPAKSVDLENDDSISFQKVPMTVHWGSCLYETLVSLQCPRPQDRLDHTFHQDSLRDLAALRLDHTFHQDSLRDLAALRLDHTFHQDSLGDLTALRLDHMFHQDSLGDLTALRCADILWFWMRGNCDQLGTNSLYNMIR